MKYVELWHITPIGPFDAESEIVPVNLMWKPPESNWKKRIKNLIEQIKKATGNKPRCTRDG